MDFILELSVYLRVFSSENFNNDLTVTIKQLQFINKINVGSEPVISWKAREVFE